MRERRLRLARAVRMHDALQTAIEARCIALANEDTRLERRALDIVASIGAGLHGDALQRMAIVRLASISHERLAIAARLAAEQERRLAADRRVRISERALERFQKESADQKLRRDLEEIRLAPTRTPASGKPGDNKV